MTDEPDFQNLCQEDISGYATDEAIAAVLRAREAHEHKRTQLQSIVDNPDADIQLGDHKLPAGSELHTGFLWGVKIALHVIGDFPIGVREKEQE